MKTPAIFLTGLILFISLSGFAQEDLLHVPPSLPSGVKVPMVVVLHGCSQNAAGIEKATQWNKLADEKKFIVLYPNLRNGKNKINCWSWYDAETQTPHGQEVKAIKSAIDNAKAQYPVDANAVYLTGISAGSGIASILLSCYPREFRAAALHSGLSFGYTQTWQEGLKMATQGPPDRPREGLVCNPRDYRGPVMTIHGDADPVVKKTNSDRIMQDFIEGSGVETQTKKVSSWHPRVRTYIQTDYLQNHQLIGRKVSIRNLKHAWSGSPPWTAFGDSHGPSSTHLIWEFFQESAER